MNGTSSKLIRGDALKEASVAWRKAHGGTFSGMFAEGPGSALSLLSSFDGADYSETGKAKDFSRMFAGQASLAIAPVFDTKEGRDFSSMFDGCESLWQIPAYDLGNAENLTGMVRGCAELQVFSCRNIGASLDLSYCRKLGKQALKEVLGNLKPVEGKVLRLGALLGLLDDADILGATGKGWTLC